MTLPDATDSPIARQLAESFDIARQAGVLPNIHGVVVVHDGRIIFESYAPGPDMALARPLGIVRFGPDTLHDLRSVTKSLVGLLYGIALAAGHVPPPDAPLLAQFPEYPDLASDPDRQALTIAHVLTMTLGMEWDELTLPYTDPRNGEIAMERAPDRYRHVLERPIVAPPGSSWTYNGGASALLGRLIAKGTGQSVEDFARAALFAPLGITAFDWHRGRDDVATAASGLRLTPRSLALIGAMCLDDGRWAGRQIVPKDWLTESFTAAVSIPDGRRYGYHWYQGAVPRADKDPGVHWEKSVSAIGNGGQRLFLLPHRNLAVAITAGNYDTQDQWRPPMVLLRDVLLPVLGGEKVSAGLRPDPPGGRAPWTRTG